MLDSVGQEVVRQTRVVCTKQTFKLTRGLCECFSCKGKIDWDGRASLRASAYLTFLGSGRSIELTLILPLQTYWLATSMVLSEDLQAYIGQLCLCYAVTLAFIRSFLILCIQSSSPGSQQTVAGRMRMLHRLLLSFQCGPPRPDGITYMPDPVLCFNHIA